MHDWRGLVRRALPELTTDPARRAEVLDELAHHLADTYDALRSSGLDETQALEETVAELDRAAMHAGDLRRSIRAGLHSRLPHSGAVMRHWFDLQQDVAYTLRLIRRNSGFAAAVIATLALGIGATTAIFSVVQGVLLRPLPYPEPARLVRVWEVTPRGADRNVVSGGNYLDWKDRATSFAAVGAHTWPFTMALTGSGDPVTVVVARATPSLFAALGVQPQLGRTFGLDKAKTAGRRRFSSATDSGAGS
jgi:putative ABC transport system permease protein